MREINKIELKASYDDFMKNLSELIDSNNPKADEYLDRIENAVFDILIELEENNEE
ncbi:hypothetical protein THOM_3058 [Trachipleistophora hominis]|uniref:Uncharacterized protein n=1 Tax=Trachipleistophora hominis TaxID=72359 RepID=L7JRV2_TRAHO|nr:hypothetical protein THOM_3058 [Trachipleistophora hominis]